MSINHIWPENYSANSSQKVWAANFAAHHPNVAVLDLSSFKCGHDAPTSGMIDAILQTSKTPSAALHDLDANKPGGSIKIRVKTYAHSLLLQKERLEDLKTCRSWRQLTRRIDEKRLELLQLRQAQLDGMRQSRTRRSSKASRSLWPSDVRAYEAPAEISSQRHGSARQEAGGRLDSKTESGAAEVPRSAAKGDGVLLGRKLADALDSLDPTIRSFIAVAASSPVVRPSRIARSF